MPDSQSNAPEAGQRANELYWNSEQTVDEIVDQLDIGRNTLYASVHPVPAGRSCPDCGERMVFTNRTNRSRGTATCRSCGREAEAGAEAGVVAGAAAEAGTSAGGADHFSNGRDGHDPEQTGWGRWRDELASVEPGRYALVGGAAALGVMVGAAAARAFREMR